MVQANNSDVDSGASEPLTTDDKPCSMGHCLVKAYPANATGIVYVSFDGTAAAADNGYHLSAGQEVVGYVANLNQINGRGSANNLGVCAVAR
jgi:hypothetical protein